jgi:nitrate reductase alpha subunit
MTDSLVRKELMGQLLGAGFAPDVHCPTGAPRESMVKITKAEAGGMDGKGLWRPAEKGLTPRHESDAMKKFIAGKFTSIK